MGAIHDGGLVVRLVRRLAALAVLLLAVAMLPDGGLLGPVRAKQAALTFLTVAGLGKILYDTFYYDHFRA
ncbi:MAG: hypothetical protein FJX72_18835 [Armatimonadetes bacterium]|nr:hypothetical protein [Armatimonadota bacterium]